MRLSIGTAVVLIALKAFALGATASVSILASLADSALDLFAALAVFYASRWAAPTDGADRGAQRKGEAMAALVQAGLVFASALFIGWEAVQRILDPSPLSGGWPAMAVMGLSILATAWLVWMQGRLSRQAAAPILAAERSRHAADQAANLVVLIGVFSGAFLRAPGLDAAAGLVVAVWLVWGAVGSLKTAADRLLEREAGADDQAGVVQAVQEDPRIEGVARLRFRTGEPATIDLSIAVAPDLTLEEARAVAASAQGRVRALHPEAVVSVCIDPLASPFPSADAAPAGPLEEPSSAPSEIEPAKPAPRGPWS